MALTQVIGSGIGQVTDIKLGGSGSANTLDDFEEGTWTPAFSASSAPTVGYSTQEGKYTKIGQTVIFHCKLLTSSKSGGSGALFITGLPFANSAVAAGAVVAGYFTGENPMKWRTSSSNIFLYYRGALTGNDLTNNSQTSDLNTSSGANQVEISGVYFTDS